MDKNNDKVILIFKNNIIIDNESEFYEEIQITDFIKNINLIASSKNIIDISRSIDLTTTSLISYAASEANKFKNALKGNDCQFIYKYMINKINCDINPIINSQIKKSIAIVKWKIYTFMMKKTNKQFNTLDLIEYNIEIINWLALLIGIYLYFDEKDELNFNQSTLLNDILKPLNINSFK